jgi:hypothetical protein
MNDRRGVLLLSLLVALILGACQLRSVTAIGPSGAGEFRTEIGFTPEERQRLEDQGASPDDFCGVARTPLAWSLRGAARRRNLVRQCPGFRESG